MKKMKHKTSILHQKDGTCYLCLMAGDFSRKTVQEHHIFGGPNRRHSEEEGLKVYLCLEHHTMGPTAVHKNRENMLMLHQIGQRAYEESHSREEFMKVFGKNYC